MTIRLNGSVSGYTQLDSPATGGNNTLVLPTGNGTANQALVTDGSGALSFADRGRMTLATAQNSTSGTSIDFTGIPSWVKRVTVMFSGVSTSGTSLVQVQLGSGSFATSGYASAASDLAGSVTTSTSTSGLLFTKNSAAVDTRTGVMRVANVTGNTWISDSTSFLTNAAVTNVASGQIALSGTLDRIRITTVNGTDTFDAGSINILYEG